MGQHTVTHDLCDPFDPLIHDPLPALGPTDPRPAPQNITRQPVVTRRR